MEKLFIASCSFGKDSLATILLALKHKEPLDRIVFAEVMFDHKKGISAEIPEHIEWIYNVAIPKLKDMGLSVDVVKSKWDYKGEVLRMRESGKYAGLHYGFPIGGHCVINRDCKIKPIHDYYRNLKKFLIEREREREREREKSCSMWESPWMNRDGSPDSSRIKFPSLPSMGSPKRWLLSCAEKTTYCPLFMLRELAEAVGAVLIATLRNTVGYAKTIQNYGVY